MAEPKRSLRAVAVSACVAVECLVAAAVGRWGTSGVALVAVGVGGAVALTSPMLLVMLVLPATWLRNRVGPPSVDLSVSDAVLTLGLIAALAYVPWRDRGVRRAMVAVAVYALVVLLTVAAHPSERAAIEWAHRVVLCTGSLLVGAALVARRLERVSLALFVGVACFFSLAAAIDAITNGLRPAYPFGLHKNAAGFLMLISVLIVVMARNALGWSWRVAGPALTLSLLGLAATQNRGAAVSLLVVLAVWGARGGVPRPLRPVAVLGGAIVLAVVITTFTTPVEGRSKFDSVESRRLTNEHALELWESSPVTGVGIRYFVEADIMLKAIREGRTFGEAHNVVVSTLAETGLVGLAALLLLVGLTLSAVRVSGSPLASLAGYLLLARIVEAQFGIWWVAGSFTAPFVIIGMAVAAWQRSDTATEPISTLTHA